MALGKGCLMSPRARVGTAMNACTYYLLYGIYMKNMKLDQGIRLLKIPETSERHARLRVVVPVSLLVFYDSIYRRSIGQCFYSARSQPSCYSSRQGCGSYPLLTFAIRFTNV